MSEGLRITGGENRGRKLFSPPKKSIRPASDMIRQAVFNMLSADLPGVEFFDVFAGTGVVGIEAVSRGAAKAVFIEHEKRQIALIERNVAHVGVGPKSNVRHADAFLWARHFAPGRLPAIVYLGPPYELCEGEAVDRLMELVSMVQSRLRAGDILVLQFSKHTPKERLPSQTGWYRLREYGKSRIGLWTPPLAAADNQPADNGPPDDARET